MSQLSDLRREANLTQVQLAEQSGMSEQAILKWEAGLHVPALESLQALARVLGSQVYEAEFGWKRDRKQRGRPRTKQATLEEQ